VWEFNFRTLTERFWGALVEWTTLSLWVIPGVQPVGIKYAWNIEFRLPENQVNYEKRENAYDESHLCKPIFYFGM
jgi:hypothetical protein